MSAASCVAPRADSRWAAASNSSASVSSLWVAASARWMSCSVP
ncbi:MAG: hypothetical protein R2713_04050 [Ilumatobacteraceae bacterium]